MNFENEKKAALKAAFLMSKLRWQHRNLENIQTYAA
jgi:hypothetical protein